MLVGLTVVSLGTSVPELAIGIDAARSGSPGLAVGNIVGANLVNLLLVLGLSAVLVPIVLDRATLRFNLPAMTAAALLLYVLSVDGTLTRSDGIILLVSATAYTSGLVRLGRRETADPPEELVTDVATDTARHRPLHQGLRLLVAIIVVVIGAELLVNGAVSS